MNRDVVVVGLGNPGDEYNGTRHNVGRDIVTQFARDHAFSDWRHDKTMRAQHAQGTVGDVSVDLLLPETYMNKSGESVKAYLVKNADARVLVVQDELDIPVGEIRISDKSSSGGHNGVQSIINALKTQNFTRLRVGIMPHTFFGRAYKPRGEREVSRFVTAPFSRRERKQLEPVIAESLEKLEELVRQK